VHQRPRRRVPPAQGLPQARRHQPGTARPDLRGSQADTRVAGLTIGPRPRYGGYSTPRRSSTSGTPAADQAAATAGSRAAPGLTRPGRVTSPPGKGSTPRPAPPRPPTRRRAPPLGPPPARAPAAPAQTDA